MKRVTLLLLVALSLGSTARGSDLLWNSDRRHSVSVGAGVGALLFGYVDSQTFDSGFITNSILGVEAPECVRSGTPIVLSLNYRYRVARLLSVGVVGSFTSEHNDYISSVDGVSQITSRDVVYLLTPELNIHWCNRSGYSIYSSLGVGVGHSKSSNLNGYEGYDRTTDGWSIQITPIGAEFYIDRVFFCYVEAGIGTLGGLRLGAGYNF